MQFIFASGPYAGEAVKPCSNSIALLSSEEALTEMLILCRDVNLPWLVNAAIWT